MLYYAIVQKHTWLANIGSKESLKRKSTVAGTGNADVGRKVNYLTNYSLKFDLILGNYNKYKNHS